MVILNSPAPEQSVFRLLVRSGDASRIVESTVGLTWLCVVLGCAERDAAVTRDLEADFFEDVEHCVVFSADDYDARSTSSRLIDSFMRRPPTGV
jgi:hypothetical protein